MAPVTCHLLNIFAFLLAGSKVYLVQSGECRTKQSSLGSTVLLLVTPIVILVVVVMYESARMLKKYFSRPADPECMSRNSEGETLAANKSIGIGCTDVLNAGPPLSNDSPDLSQQMSSDEPSGANEVSEDPPVQLQRNVVHYTQLEQHGGVTIMGDGANINHHHHHHHYHHHHHHYHYHHYPPQN